MYKYVGNGAYCYSDSMAMLLATIGETINPAQLEVLTGVGLGAIWVKEMKMPFFNNLATMPDRGLGVALKTLGFDYTEKWGDDPDAPPFAALRADLAVGPAVLGPLDFGYLSYNPIHQDAGGADHYVFAYAADDRGVYLHDPDGYPYVHLPYEHLATAWKAERIPYRREPYRYWLNPIRVAQPTEDAIYNQALAYFQSLYQETDTLAAQEHWVIGSEAMRLFADYLRSGMVTENTLSQAVFFSFPLGARRANDFVAFFRERHPELAELKHQQAKLFGKCHTLTVQKNLGAAADALNELAGIEDEFRATLLAVAVEPGSVVST